MVHSMSWTEVWGWLRGQTVRGVDAECGDAIFGGVFIGGGVLSLGAGRSAAHRLARAGRGRLSLLAVLAVETGSINCSGRPRVPRRRCAAIGHPATTAGGCPAVPPRTAGAVLRAERHPHPPARGAHLRAAAAAVSVGGVSQRAVLVLARDRCARSRRPGARIRQAAVSPAAGRPASVQRECSCPGRLSGAVMSAEFLPVGAVQNRLHRPVLSHSAASGGGAGASEGAHVVGQGALATRPPARPHRVPGATSRCAQMSLLLHHSEHLPRHARLWRTAQPRPVPIPTATTPQSHVGGGAPAPARQATAGAAAAARGAAALHPIHRIAARTDQSLRQRLQLLSVPVPRRHPPQQRRPRCGVSGGGARPARLHPRPQRQRRRQSVGVRVAPGVWLRPVPPIHRFLLVVSAGVVRALAAGTGAGGVYRGLRPRPAGVYGAGVSVSGHAGGGRRRRPADAVEVHSGRPPSKRPRWAHALTGATERGAVGGAAGYLRAVER
eukprot:ctg_1462.g563